MDKKKYLSAALAAALLASCRPAPPTPTPEPAPVAAMDLSGADEEGRVRVKLIGEAQPPVKVQVTRAGEETRYNYDLPTDGTEITLPLTLGDGDYTVTVLEHAHDELYKPLYSESLTLALADPNAPFLRPSRMVEYGPDIEALAAEVTAGEETVPGIIDAALRYVTDTIAYDHEKVDTVESGYIPNPSETVATGTGLCYDYAALLTSLLRSRGVPCRLEVGWAGELYHAWVSVWSEEGGELTGPIVLNRGWTLLDPTFLSSKGYTEIMLAYMARPENYRARYMY